MALLAAEILLGTLLLILISRIGSNSIHSALKIANKERIFKILLTINLTFFVLVLGLASATVNTDRELGIVLLLYYLLSTITVAFIVLKSLTPQSILKYYVQDEFPSAYPVKIGDVLNTPGRLFYVLGLCSCEVHRITSMFLVPINTDTDGCYVLKPSEFTSSGSVWRLNSNLLKSLMGLPDYIFIKEVNLMVLVVILANEEDITILNPTNSRLTEEDRELARELLVSCL